MRQEINKIAYADYFDADTHSKTWQCYLLGNLALKGLETRFYA